MVVQNPTCQVTITPVAGSPISLPQKLVYVQTHKILTTMTGDFEIDIANGLDTYPRTMFPPHSAVSVTINGVNCFNGYVTSSESQYGYNKDEMMTVVRGKDYPEDFINTQIRRAWLQTPYTTIMNDIIGAVNLEQSTSYAARITTNSDSSNTPYYYPINNVDALNSIRNICGLISASGVQYDWFIDNSKNVMIFPREAKPGAQTIQMIWGNNFITFDVTDDVDKMRNKVKIYGGQLQTPDYTSTPNQIDASPPLVAEAENGSDAYLYGTRDDFVEAQNEKNATWLSNESGNRLSFEDTIEERILAIITGNPAPNPADILQVTSPWGSINGNYYIFEVTQIFDGRNDQYTTQLSVGHDILKFSSASARLQTRIDEISQKEHFTHKPNFNWSRTGVAFANGIGAGSCTATANALVNPKYSLDQYDFSSVQSYTICNVTSPPQTFTVVSDTDQNEIFPVFATITFPSSIIQQITSFFNLLTNDIDSSSLAQKIILANAVDKLTVKVLMDEVGIPDQGFHIALWNDANGVPGTEIQYVAFSPSDLSTSPQQLQAVFTGLGPDTTYWVTIYVTPVGTSDPSLNYYQVYGKYQLGKIPANNYSGAAATSINCDSIGTPTAWQLQYQAGTDRTTAAFAALCVSFAYEVENPVDYYGIKLSGPCNWSNPSAPAPTQYPLILNSNGAGQVTITDPGMADANGQITSLMSSTAAIGHFNYVANFSNTKFR